MTAERLSVGNNSFKEYQKRINTVLEYIDVNLGSRLTIETLAEVACFSPYHFHRIFHSLTGNSVAQYIKRLRLSKAAQKLVYNNGLSVTDIALEYGFSSPSDFSRAFKAYFKLTPSEYAEAKERESLYHNSLDKLRRPELLTDLPPISENYEKNIRIEKLGDIYGAYIRVVGLSEELKSREIEGAYQRLYRWAKARELLCEHTRIFGITLDSPEITQIDQCRFDACITVPEVTKPEGEIGVRLIKAEGKYAVYRFGREEPKLGETFFKAMDYLYGRWMPFNGFMPQDKPFIEFYYASTSGEILTDFCIPIFPI